MHCFVTFLLLILSKILSSEFQTDSSLMKKYYKIQFLISGNYHENVVLLRRHSGICFGKSFKYSFERVKSFNTFCLLDPTCITDILASQSWVLTNYCPVFLFYSSWKHQKTASFLTFSGAVKMKHWAIKS